MITLLLHLLRFLPFLFGGHRQLALENLALRQQLAVYKRTIVRPPLCPADRFFWIGLAKNLDWVAAGPRDRDPGHRPALAAAALSRVLVQALRQFERRSPASST